MQAAEVDPDLVRAVLAHEVELAPLESGREAEILKNMRKCGMRRYGDMLRHTPRDVGVLVGYEAFLQLCEQLENFHAHNVPVHFGMDTESYGY